MKGDLNTYRYCSVTRRVVKGDLNTNGFAIEIDPFAILEVSGHVEAGNLSLGTFSTLDVKGNASFTLTSNVLGGSCTRDGCDPAFFNTSIPRYGYAYYPACETRRRYKPLHTAASGTRRRAIVLPEITQSNQSRLRTRSTRLRAHVFDVPRESHGNRTRTARPSHTPTARPPLAIPHAGRTSNLRQSSSLGLERRCATCGQTLWSVATSL